MTHYSSQHWGTYEIEGVGTDAPRIKALGLDPAASPIGLHQLDPAVTAMRVKRPAVRRSWLEGGPKDNRGGTRTDLRGREAFVEVSWETALDLVAGEIRRVKDTHGNEAIFGGSYGWSSAGRFHHAQSQVHRFLNAVGGYVRHMDSYSLGAGRVLMPHIVASMDELMHMHTSWDVMAAHTKLFVTFGGVPIKNSQMTPGGAGRHRVPGGLQAMAAAGVRFVNIGPVNDNLETGGPVEWIQIRPNTDTAMMLALGHVLVTEGLLDRGFLARCTVGFERFEPYLLGETDGIAKTPAWASAITGVPAERITALAREMAGTRTMLNCAWALQRSAHGEQPFWGLTALASMLGQIGLPGGGFGLGYGAANNVGSPHMKLPGPTLPQGVNAVRAFIPVARVADMLLNPGQPFTYNGTTQAYPDIHLVYWAGGNPYHHHQDLNRFRRAWQKPDTVVVHEQYWTATAKMADIVLPATTNLERDDIGYATLEGFFVAMKQAVPPVGEARDDYAIFAALAERLGAAERFTEGRTTRQWLEHLYEDARGKAARRDFALPPFEQFWEAGVIDLAPWDQPVVMLAEFRADPQRHKLGTPSGRIEIFSEKIAGFSLEDCPGHPVWQEPYEWLGSAAAGRFPLHLISDQPTRRLHSQLDPSPHSRAGKIEGREAVWLNPADAGARGIREGDVVELFNDRGRCLAGARLSNQIMPGVARLNTGAWYDPDPETGLERHGNPNALTLDRGASGLSQGCAAQTCLVDVRGPVNELPEIRAFQPPAFVG